MNDPRKTSSIYAPMGRCDQKPSPTDTSLIALNLASTEYAVLMTARYFFASYANPKGAAWMSVFLGCDDFFPGHKNALEIAQSVLQLVHEIRQSRTSTLRFSNPHCLDCANIVTSSERHLIMILRDLDERRTSSATTHALLLCEGNEIQGTINAARQLAGQL